MPLYIVPTPIGNYEDITLRGRRVLSECDCVIGEEYRPTSTLLKKIGLEQKEIYELNEHSKAKDIAELVELCRKKNVAFVSDCGTPNFCDPGHQLILPLRREKVPIIALPGPSSLSLILSLTSQKISNFIFEGFLPAEKELRATKIRSLQNEKRAIVILETPYRIHALIKDLSNGLQNRKALLGLDLTLETEKVFEGSLKNISEQMGETTKAEPVLLIYPI